MLNQKNYLMAITVAGIATLNIAAPVFAANQIVLKHRVLPIEWQFSLAEIDEFVQTGNTDGLPPDFLTLMNADSDTSDPEDIQQQFKTTISIDPNSPLDNREVKFLNLLMPRNTEAERKAALTLMAKGNGQVLIDFLKALPGETLTEANFIEVLMAYQVPPIKPPTPEPNPPETIPVEPVPEPNPPETIPVEPVPEPYPPETIPVEPVPEPYPPETIPVEPVPEPYPPETTPVKSVPEPASTLGLLGFSIWAFIKKQKL